MKKFAMYFVSIVLLLTACQKASSDGSFLTLNQVLSTFKEQQLLLKEMKLRNNEIFGMKLNGVRPSLYELDGKKFLIYIYHSSKERKKGLEDFWEKTENSNTVSYKYFEVENVLFFYVYVMDQDKDMDNKIQNIMSILSKNNNVSRQKSL